MAYGNWGAFVYRNGKRAKDHEDASFRKNAYGRDDVKHAVLGGGRVRLCGYKCYPELFVDGEERELKWKGGVSHQELSGSVEGFDWSAEMTENMVHLYLREPDGTVWSASCGFEHGAGFDD